MKLVLALKRLGADDYVVNRVAGRDWPVTFTTSAAAAEFQELYALEAITRVVVRQSSELPFPGQWLDYEFEEIEKGQKVEL